MTSSAGQRLNTQAWVFPPNRSARKAPKPTLRPGGAWRCRKRPQPRRPEPSNTGKRRWGRPGARSTGSHLGVQGFRGALAEPFPQQQAGRASPRVRSSSPAPGWAERGTAGPGRPPHAAREPVGAGATGRGEPRAPGAHPALCPGR